MLRMKAVIPNIPSPTLLADPETRRALQLDALSAILPIDRRDRLAQLLTDDDVETLKHLAREGMGENTLRALASDLAYLEAWALTATGSPLPWPAPEALTLKFVAHHLWDPAKRETDLNHGMPAAVGAGLRSEALLRLEGPHAPATVRRRLSHWATLHRWRGLNGPFASHALRAALRLAVRAAARPRTRKSRRAITGDILEKLLATCGTGRLADSRDRAILLVAFGSGGRRRSEVAQLRVEQLVDDIKVPADPKDPRAEAAETEFVTISRAGPRVSWMALRPHTGRTHQLRAHMAHVGHPIVGDPKYFSIENWQLPGGMQNKLHLMARRIAIPHPRGGTIDVTAPMPLHMQQSWNLLGLEATRYDPIVDAPEE